MASWSLYSVILIYLGTYAVSATSATRATEPSQPTGRQYEIEIPADGLAKDEQHEVNLQGGDKLQIVDKTKTATVQPEKFSSEAYTYDRNQGSCDMKNRLVYKTAFPLAPSNYAFWVTAPSPLDSETQVNHTFTAPAAEQLQGSVSFCLELQVKAGSGTSVKPESGSGSSRSLVHSTKLRALKTQRASPHQTSGHDGVPENHSQVAHEQAGQVGETGTKKVTVIVHSGGSSLFVSGAVTIVFLGSWFYSHA